MSSRAEPSAWTPPRAPAPCGPPPPNVMPVSRELLADLETPISAYLRLRDLPSSFLLDSVEGPAQVARFSVLGGGPAPGPGVRRRGGPGAPARRRPSPSAGARWRRSRASSAAIAPRGTRSCRPSRAGSSATSPTTPCACGSACLDCPPDDLGLPVFRLALMDTVVVFDHRSHTLRIVANAFLDEDGGAERAQARARERIDQILERLRNPRPRSRRPCRSRSKPRLNWTPEADRAGGGAGAGAHPGGGHLPGDPLPSASRRPCRGSIPSPSTARSAWSIRRLTCSSSTPGTARRWSARSPSAWCASRTAGSRCGPSPARAPAAATGTRTRPTPGRSWPTPRSGLEHVMLVDLTRNDVGRVARYGSVRVSELLTIERRR